MQERITREVLEQMYVQQNMSIITIAKQLHHRSTTIARALEQYGIPQRARGWHMCHPPLVLSQHQREVLYGALLGDGCLWKSKQGRNAQFTYTSKSRQHVEFVYQQLGIPCAQGIQEYVYTDKRTQKTYTRYCFRTEHNITFEEERQRWYPNGKKIVPKDIALTPTTCLIWYIGDGSLNNVKSSQFIKLSTDAFSVENVQDLCNQLSAFDAHYWSNHGQPRLYISRQYIRHFLEYIGPCPFNDYAYKWNFKPYKKECIQHHPERIDQMIQLFQEGYSAGTIAKKVGVDRSTVVTYLTKNGYDYREHLFRKKGR